MSAVTNYSRVLLIASQAAETSCKTVKKYLTSYMKGDERESTARLINKELDDLDSRHKIFQNCIRTALRFPNPTEKDSEKIFALLHLRQFYGISLQRPETEEKSVEISNKRPEWDVLLKQSFQAVPKISEFSRANLVAIGTLLKNTKTTVIETQPRLEGQ